MPTLSWIFGFFQIFFKLNVSKGNVSISVAEHDERLNEKLPIADNLANANLSIPVELHRSLCGAEHSNTAEDLY